ncbi:MAG: hypothetical protein H7199_12135 [Burkholderiales bacterium]|nr:hypothetical protein [Flavobacterium sp.]
MKKLIAVVILLFAFTITANAQDKKAVVSTTSSQKLSNEDAARKDIASLIARVTINENLKKDLFTLMVMKHEALSNPQLTAADRDAISKGFEHKLMAGLTEAQRSQLSSYPELLKQMSH